MDGFSATVSCFTADRVGSFTSGRRDASLGPSSSNSCLVASQGHCASTAMAIHTLSCAKAKRADEGCSSEFAFEGIICCSLVTEATFYTSFALWS